MNCPNCNNKTSIVTLDSINSGLKIKVNQCQSCGGIWVNKNELYQIDPREVSKFARASDLLFKKPAKINPEIRCPIDNNLLSLLSDPLLPKSIEIRYCSACRGMWLNIVELIEFKKNQANKLRKAKIETKDFYKSPKEEMPIIESPEFFISLIVPPPLDKFAAKAILLPEESIPVLTKTEQELVRSVPENKRAQVYWTLINEKKDLKQAEKNAVNIVMGLMSLMRYALRFIAGF